MTKIKNFIENKIDEDLKEKKVTNVVTRFPPEPNGYLHIGHAKSICLNFGIKNDYSGKCNLRFDDTNPLTEDLHFVESIKEDVEWLGYDWDKLCFASDYFEQLYDFAVELIKNGHSYVDSLTENEVKELRGSHTTPGKNSPYRSRTIEENLDLFKRMRDGDFDDGEHVLRAKIDMSSGNMNMRDPLLYRIRKNVPPVRGKKWHIYPLYDFAHTLSDAIEGVSHSLCTLEFEDHRPLYNWFLEKLKIKMPPKQIEFSKLQFSNVILSKRNLKKLVDENYVSGWDDPRLPTIRGLRRRGYTPESIKSFCALIGISKSNSQIDFSILEDSLRVDLDKNAHRKFVILDPLKVVLTNYDKTEELVLSNHPKFEEEGTRTLVFENELWIEKSDFEETPPKGFKRLTLGGEVRLRNSYVIRCDEVIKNDDGNILELRCSVDIETLGKKPEGRKVKGVIHWLPVKYALPASINLYENLFNDFDQSQVDLESFSRIINPNSLKIKNGFVEPSLKYAKPGEKFQFERTGYFSVDDESTEENLIFNRAVNLRSDKSLKST